MNMKNLFIALVALTSIQAQAGSLSCLIEDGSIITAQVDGEANVEGLKITSSSGNSSVLQVEGLDLMNNKMELAASGRIDGERMNYLIKVDALNVLSKATVSDGARQAPLVQAASCVVLFKAGI